MDRGLWTSALVGFLAPVVLFAPLDSSRAWVTSLLNEARQHAVAAAPAHPQVTVGREDRRAGPSKAKPERVARAKSGVHVVVAPPFDPKAQLAQTIDPNKRPDWYLIDPTIRRGDILFLRNRVVVFKGGRIGDLSDYVSVGSTRLLSRKERRQIEALAPRPAPTTPVASRLAPQSLVKASVD